METKLNRTFHLLAVVTVFFAACPAVQAADVDIRCQLLTRFAGAETASGRIVVAVTNTSGHPLTELTLRLADPAGGRITGPVQDDLSLAVGETRKLEGDFVLSVDALKPGEGLDWRVVYADAHGFAHQLMVRSEPLPADGAAMDADQARAVTAHP